MVDFEMLTSDKYCATNCLKVYTINPKSLACHVYSLTGGLLLPYFSLGSAFLNPNVDHWCMEKNITALLEEYPDARLPHGIESNIIWFVKVMEL